MDVRSYSHFNQGVAENQFMSNAECDYGETLLSLKKEFLKDETLTIDTITDFLKNLALSGTTIHCIWVRKGEIAPSMSVTKNEDGSINHYTNGVSEIHERLLNDQLFPLTNEMPEKWTSFTSENYKVYILSLIHI